MRYTLLAKLFAGIFTLTALQHTLVRAEDPAAVVQEDFESGAQRWTFTDENAWKVVESDGQGQVLALVQQSKYQPPHRSPVNIALLEDEVFGSFELEMDVRTTTRSYGHRDICIFFGYQDPGHFYYVHLGQKTDDHANQIFLVDGAPRTKISSKTTPGTNWDDAWHHVKLTRNAKTGEIAVYFDDMEEPAMKAADISFGPGLIGIGSFDDTGEFDNIVIRRK